MIDNSTNIKKNVPSPLTLNHWIKDHDKWNWNSRFWLGASTKNVAGLSQFIGIPALPSW